MAGRDRRGVTVRIDSQTLCQGLSDSGGDVGLGPHGRLSGVSNKQTLVGVNEASPSQSRVPRTCRSGKAERRWNRSHSRRKIYSSLPLW